MENIYDLIIIGGGPGGIGSAVEAKVLGLEKVLMIEKTDNHSHTIRKFYKDKKRVDKDWQLDYFDNLLDDEIIDTRFNCAVEGVKKEDDIFHVTSGCGVDMAKNIIVCIGRMGKPNKPSYKIPPSLKTQINFNLDKCSNGEKILIVGGGDTAVEYACELSETNEVVLNYRREMLSRPNPTNLEMIAKYEDAAAVTVKLGVDIESLESEHGQVKVNFSDGAELFDRIIYAIGGTTPKDFLKSCGITLDDTGEPIFDENYESEVEGLFVAGDIVFNSGGSIAIALNHGYRIVTYILNKEK
jgi:thioredoxin reductase (NADPH)